MQGIIIKYLNQLDSFRRKNLYEKMEISEKIYDLW